MADFRHTSAVRISIGGKDIHETGFAIRILDLTVNLRDDKVDEFQLKLIVNEIEDSADTSIAEFTSVDITIVFEDSELPLGRFFILDTKLRYVENYGKELKISGGGEEIILDRSEIRTYYENKTDSEIVKEIADLYGLASEIVPTKLKYERVQHINMTHLEFIRERADLNGYIMNVYNGLLYFGPRKSSSLDGEFTHEGVGSLIDVVTVHSPTHRVANTMVASFYDPINRILATDVYNGESSPYLDEILAGENVSEKQSMFDLINYENPQLDFKVLDPHNSSAVELREMLRTKGQFDSTSIKAMFKMQAITGDIKPGKTIKLSGIDPFSSKYYIRALKFMFHDEGRKSLDMRLLGETSLMSKRVNAFPEDVNPARVHVDNNEVLPIVVTNKVMTE